jgi:hypothetical protein
MTIALFALLLVVLVGLASLALIAPWWCAVPLGFVGWQFGSAWLDMLHAVHGIETC